MSRSLISSICPNANLRSACKLAVMSFLLFGYPDVLPTVAHMPATAHAAGHTSAIAKKLSDELDKGSNLAKAQKYKEASKVFRALIDEGMKHNEPEANSTVVHALGMQCMNAFFAKDYKESLFYCEMSIRETSNYAHEIARHQLANSLHYKMLALRKLGRFDETVPLHKQIITEFRGHKDSNLNAYALESMVGLADYYRDKQQPGRALPLYKDAFTSSKGVKSSSGRTVYYLSYFGLGMTYAELGKIQLAKETLTGFIDFFHDIQRDFIQEKVQIAKAKLASLGSSTNSTSTKQNPKASLAELRKLSEGYLYGDIRYDENQKLQVNVPKIREMMTRLGDVKDLIIQKDVAMAAAMTGYYLKNKKDHDAAQEFYISYIVHSRDILDADFQRMYGDIFMLAGMNAFRKKQYERAMNIFDEMEDRLGNDTSQELDRSFAIARKYNAICNAIQGNHERVNLLHARIIGRHANSQNPTVRDIVSTALYYMAASYHYKSPANDEMALSTLKSLKDHVQKPSRARQKYELARGLHLESSIQADHGKTKEAIGCIEKSIALYKTLSSKRAKKALAKAEQWHNHLMQTL